MRASTRQALKISCDGREGEREGRDVREEGGGAVLCPHLVLR